MKHIKLFEQFDVSKIDLTTVVILEASIEDVKTNDDGYTSGTFILDYYRNPSEDQIDISTGNYDPIEKKEIPYKDVDSIIYEIVSGDQNGLNIVQNGPLTLLIDKSISPNEIEEEMRGYIISMEDLPGDVEPVYSDLFFKIH
jgi:hypothetical protein